MTDLVPLHMALRFRAERGDTAPGRALADLRVRIAEQDGDGRLPAARVALVAEFARRLMSIGIEDMPPDADDLAVMVDAIAFRHGYTTRAEAWRSIGVSPDTGRGLLGKQSGRVDWPIWYTLRAAALGD